MRETERDELQAGACYDLLPQVVDKYFFSGERGTFVNLTGKAICANCIIQQECLEDAIANPIGDSLRGGETPESIRALAYQHRTERTPIPVLARTALRQQLPLEGRPFGRPHLLRGDFM